MLENQRLGVMRKRLDQVNRVWTADKYKALLDFYVRILPSIVGCERCSIFVVDQQSQEIISTVGTGLDNQVIVAPSKDSVVGHVIATGLSCIENTLSQTGYHTKTHEQTGFSCRNILCVPMNSLTDGKIMGAVEVLNKINSETRQHEEFDKQDLNVLSEVASYLAMAMENVLISQDILRISSQLNDEIDILREQPAQGFIAVSGLMQKILDQVKAIAKVPVSVIVFGENGTGKEQIAKMLHKLSARNAGPFVAVNCAAIPENLVESEFFGYEKGAFTGASGAKQGLFEDARGGTLFLDEIGEMPLNMQPKLLRALQECEGMRLGGNKVISYDFRVVCATNKNLQEEVKKGNFREDLFYRLYSVEINLPPLRERRDDISSLGLTFLDECREKFNKVVGGFSADVLRAFSIYQWPGNVRQLRREVERMVALTPEGEAITLEYASADLKSAATAAISTKLDRHNLLLSELTMPEQVAQLEQNLITQALETLSGNKSAVARQLGITRQGLHKKLARYQIH